MEQCANSMALDRHLEEERKKDVAYDILDGMITEKAKVLMTEINGLMEELGMEIGNDEIVEIIKESM